MGKIGGVFLFEEGDEFFGAGEEFFFLLELVGSEPFVVTAFEIFDEGAGVFVGVHDDEDFVFEEFVGFFVEVAFAID